MKRWVDGSINVNVLLSFAFGTLFVSIILGFSAFNPYPSGFTQWVFITVLALAAAGVGAVIPGILDIKLPHVKAGGALALFVIVFLMKPAIISSLPIINPPQGSPDPAISSYLSAVDNNDFDAAWLQLDSESKAGVARDRTAYKQAYESVRRPLGTVESRILIGMQELQSPSGHAPGVYRVIAYRTKFKSGSCYSEQVAARGSTDKVWRVYEHNIFPIPIPC